MANVWDELNSDFFALEDPWIRETQREIHRTVFTHQPREAASHEYWGVGESDPRSDSDIDPTEALPEATPTQMQIAVGGMRLKSFLGFTGGGLKSEALPWALLFVGSSAFAFRSFESGEWLFTALTMAFLSLYLLVVSVFGKE